MDPVKPQPTELLKPQPTLKGYYAWVVMELVKRNGESPAEVAQWMIREWIHDKDHELIKYGISWKLYQKRRGKGMADDDEEDLSSEPS